MISFGSKMRKKINIGSWITTYNPDSVDLMSSLGFKWLCVDMEHSTITFDQMGILISTIKNNNSIPFVRVGSNNQLEIKKALDSGAQGIIVPMVNDVRDAKNAINSVYYYPKGTRGVGLTRASNYGYNFENYVKKDSKKIQLILQIENIKGINNLDKILELKGISGTLLGPYDLSQSLGVIGKLNNHLVKKAIKKYENISKRKKIPMGIHIANPDLQKVKFALKNKYKFVATGTDMIFLGDSCLNFLKKFKK